MADKKYNVDDILRIFSKLEKKIEDLACFVKECCAKIPVNVGTGIGLFKKFNQNKWEFKSLIAGDNVFITEQSNTITINSTSEPFTCQDVDTCLGISELGSPTKFLNEQGDFTSVCSSLNSCSTTNLPEGSNLYFTNERAQDAVGNILTNTATINLTYNDAGNIITADFASLLISQFTNDAGYITSSGASLTDTYVGYGSNTNTLTGSSNFIYDAINQVFDVKFGSPGLSYLKVEPPIQYALLDNTITKLELDSTTAKISIAGDKVLDLDRIFSIYSIGANGFDFNTHILIDDTAGGKNIQLNSTNGVIVSNLATGGTEMVVADSTGLLYKQTIPTGTVTSVQLSSGTGISLSGTNPITTSGTITVTNTAPDQTVVLTQGGTTTITGTYPNFTISSADQFTGTVTSVSALTIGTTGTDLSSTVANSTTTPVITLNVPTASASNRGALSAADWTTFNSKEPAITWSQGDILYGTGANTYTQLAKNTSATRYLSNTGTSNNPAWSQVDLSNGVTGILASGNGGNDAWINYSATSTVTGWSSFTTKVIRYQQSYKRITLEFNLQGTSNSTTTTFTLPVALGASSGNVILVCYVTDNGGAAQTGRAVILTSGTTVTFSRDVAGTAFTGSGSKSVVGTIEYETN